MAKIANHPIPSIEVDDCQPHLEVIGNRTTSNGILLTELSILIRFLLNPPAFIFLTFYFYQSQKRTKSSPSPLPPLNLNVIIPPANTFFSYSSSTITFNRTSLRECPSIFIFHLFSSSSVYPIISIIVSTN